MSTETEGPEELFDEHLHGARRRLIHRSPSENASRAPSCHMAGIALSNVLKNAVVAAENYSDARVLVKDGRWNVPVTQRPKNWEAMGVPE